METILTIIKSGILEASMHVSKREARVKILEIVLGVKVVHLCVAFGAEGSRLEEGLLKVHTSAVHIQPRIHVV